MTIDIDKERELFEAHIYKLNPAAFFLGRWPNDGDYKSHATSGWWKGWQARASTPPSTEGALEVAEPEFSHDPDGELCIDWYMGEARLSISIGGKGRVSWAALSGDKKACGAQDFDISLTAMPKYVPSPPLDWSEPDSEGAMEGQAADWPITVTVHEMFMMDDNYSNPENDQTGTHYVVRITNSTLLRPRDSKGRPSMDGILDVFDSMQESAAQRVADQYRAVLAPQSAPAMKEKPDVQGK